MKPITSIEDRIVTLQKVTADGVESVVEAELRQLDMNGMDPTKNEVVRARGFGVSLTMDWDFSNQRFSTEIGGVNFHSNFDYKEYISEPWQHGKNYVRSSRRK